MRVWLPWLLLFACSMVRAADRAPQRVISLSPSTADMVVELGAGEQLLAMIDAGPRPAALQHAISLGRYTEVSFEQVLALKPDLVLIWDGGETPRLLEQLSSAGIALWVAQPTTLDDIPRLLIELGDLLGRQKRAQWLAADFTQRQRVLVTRYQRTQPLRVFYQVWHQPLYTLGGPQPVSDALQVCGGQNVFAQLRQPAPVVSVEAVLAANPDVIIMGADDTRLQRAQWMAYPQLAAAQKQQVLLLDATQLERPSYQMIAAVERLCEVLSHAQ
ncbi:cobalamin-binding protein [Atopomonas sediminilitoris]|uniref:cobalamin-binding protein n=1 Tax=Atopomonas sediminilitoris TaxID=2919919 RepID=UPI001F4EB4D0|nr:cobalamin-binding protein [Atopomonas sediminilitoris]MCJ8170188.1 cobalamin-binding protein [Atopomonas sediminilitoris]